MEEEEYEEDYENYEDYEEEYETASSFKTRFSFRDFIYTFLRLLIFALLLAFVWFNLTLVGAKDVDLRLIEKALSEKEGISSLVLQDANELQKRLGLSSAEFSQFYYLSSDSLMDVSELFIAHTPNEETLAQAEEKILAHLAAQKDSFRDYGTNQYDLLNQAIVYTRGNYIFYAVSQQAPDWENAFLSCIR